jgi:hypothetical protein
LSRLGTGSPPPADAEGGASPGDGGGGVAGEGGAPPPGCAVVPDDNACTDDVCVDGVPSHVPMPAGTEVANVAMDDCVHDVCDGRGAVESAGNPAETPPQTGDPCWAEVCTASGDVGTVPAPNGTVCDGGYCYEGVCSECADATHCPPADTCKVAVCDQGSCHVADEDDYAGCSPPSLGHCCEGACVDFAVVCDPF